MGVLKIENRLGETNVNHQGCLMKIIKYENANNIIVEFQDEYKGKVHTSYQMFSIGNVKNPYYPDVFGVGIIGNKYPAKISNIHLKEYSAWHGIMQRCYDEKYKIKRPTYQDIMVCKEWLLYDNFYEWLHEQENFKQWYDGKMWAIDKDVLMKGNKIYSPETCCLVPNNVNGLFVKCNSARGNLPIGVSKKNNGYAVYCQNPFTKENDYLGSYSTLENSFRVYKSYKEKIIKQVAKTEFDKGNITKRCYEAMMNYQVEITD